MDLIHDDDSKVDKSAACWQLHHINMRISFRELNVYQNY